MNEKELLKSIREGESETLEFKTSLSEWKEVIKTLAAFAWAQGGKILFGISRSEKISGVEICEGTIENLANNINKTLIQGISKDNPRQIKALHYINEHGKITIGCTEGFVMW